MNYFLNALKNHYADFSGRARRSEYWYYTLFNTLILFGIIGIGFGLGMAMESEMLISGATLVYTLFAIGTFIPSLAVAVRRLHDTNKSGWWILLGFIPLIGGIVLLVFLCTDSDPGANQFGNNPKEFGGDIAEHLVG